MKSQVLIAFYGVGKAVSSTAPNLVVIFFDDFGWSDASFNDPTVQETPNLLKIAESSKVFTDFHSAASVCTPARAALLTGRYGLRSGVYTNFAPESVGGLPEGELILPGLLADSHDAHMVGKWHMGHHDAFQPTVRGFQSWLGLPYSGDMGCLDTTPASCKPDVNRSLSTPVCPALCVGDNEIANTPGIPLYNSVGANCSGRAFNEGCNGDIAEQPVNEFNLNRRYADSIVEFFHARGEVAEAKPFLLYVGFAHTHTPMAYDPAFENASSRPGWTQAFGNVLAELDYTVGRIVDALDDSGLRNDTLLVITADNGPADLPSVDCDFIGNTAPYTGAWQQKNGGRFTGTSKCSTWEGGHRAATLISWPGHIAPGSTDVLASTLDIVPTFLELAGVSVPSDRVFDGEDLSPVLFDNVAAWPTPRVLFHPDGKGNLTAGRYGQYKLFTETSGTRPCFNHAEGAAKPRHLEEEAYKLGSVIDWGDAPLVFDLTSDPSESTPIEAPTEVVQLYLQALQEKRASIDATLKHTVDWSKNGAAAWPCSNHESSSCRKATVELV